MYVQYIRDRRGKKHKEKSLEVEKCANGAKLK